VVTLFWTTDVDGHHIVGVEGLSLSSLIVSTNQLRVPNLGPRLYLTYQPFVGTNPLAANLFGTNAPSAMPAIPGDTILIDEVRTIPANSTQVFYPADYFAGYTRVWLQAPPGVMVTMYASDLTLQWWPLETFTNGAVTTITPMGTWMVVVWNANHEPVDYALAVTPLFVTSGINPPSGESRRR
jgi:hypothetical protein